MNSIINDPNFRAVLHALEQRGGPVKLQEHGVMTVGRSFKWSVNRAPYIVTSLEIPPAVSAETAVRVQIIKDMRAKK